MREIKFLSLQKAELAYEVSIRGDTPAGTVEQLRKQIVKLGPLFPSEDILVSQLEPAADLAAVEETLLKVDAYLKDLATDYDEGVYLRARNLFTHLTYRLRRIDCGGLPDVRVKLTDVRKRYERLMVRLDVFSKPGSSSKDHQTSEPDKPVPPVIAVTCDRGSTLELAKLKYDGKSCARAFVRRVEEFIVSRGIPESRLLSSATEIFTGDALHWYRGIKDSISSWTDVAVRLKEDFGYADYDYRFLAEIRARTQGERENITIYLSVMAGMFSQLDKKLSEDEKLEIILHNIRPCYASVLSSSMQLNTIEDLRTICKNYENIQSRLSNFHEPPKATSDTMAPEFAYSHASSSTKSFKQSFVANNDSKPSVANNNTNYNRPFQRRPFSHNQSSSNGISKFNSSQVSAIRQDYSSFCPRCRVNTHNLYSCTDRAIVCFGCGKPGVRSIDCPKCGNNKPSASKN